MQRVNYASGAQWEEIVGYSRAVKIGNVVEVTGTVAVDEKNQVVGKDNAYEQAKYVLHKIEKVLERAGASMKDVILAGSTTEVSVKCTGDSCCTMKQTETVSKCRAHSFAGTRVATIAFQMRAPSRWVARRVSRSAAWPGLRVDVR